MPGADVGAFELAHQVRGQVALGNVDHYEHPLPVGADANVYVYKHHRVNVSLDNVLYGIAHFFVVGNARKRGAGCISALA